METSPRIALFVGTGVISSLFSIFVSGLFLFLALLLWLGHCWKVRKLELRAPPFTILLAAFAGWSLISICFSPDPAQSLLYLKKFIKFLYIFLIVSYFRSRDVFRLFHWIFAVLGASAFYGILQYLWLKDVDLMNRIDGFMSHWMTFSGQLMLGALCLIGYLCVCLRDVPASMRSSRTTGSQQLHRLSLALILPILLIALLLTLTRSALVGFGGGLLVWLLVFQYRWALLLGLGLSSLLLFLILPTGFQDRIYSSFDPEDMTTRGRIEHLQTGLQMIEAHPLTGVGPRLVPEQAPLYRRSNSFPRWHYQHLHNNGIQVAAELGLPALVFWLGIWIWMVCDFIRFLQRSGDRLLRLVTLNALSVLTAFQLAGFFEYNFGDSEIMILLLFFLTAPYVVAREAETESAI